MLTINHKNVAVLYSYVTLYRNNRTVRFCFCRRPESFPPLQSRPAAFHCRLDELRLVYNCHNVTTSRSCLPRRGICGRQTLLQSVRIQSERWTDNRRSTVAQEDGQTNIRRPDGVYLSSQTPSVIDYYAWKRRRPIALQTSWVLTATNKTELNDIVVVLTKAAALACGAIW